MATMQTKDFLGFKATLNHDILTTKGKLTVDNPYRYSCTLGANTTCLKLTPQQGTSLVRQSIVESNQNNKSVFWYRRADNKEDILKSIKANSNEFTLCCIENYIEMPVDHAQKPDNLLKLIADKLSTIGANACYPIKPEDFIYCNIPIEPDGNDWDSAEGSEICQHLEKSGLLKKYWSLQTTMDGCRFYNILPPAEGMWTISLTMDGWASLSSLGTQPSNNVFIAMAFTVWENTEEKNNLISAIKKACKNFGYDANIVDQNHTGFITHKIMTEIKQSRFVICDFTYQNQGVYFEAGYARALGKNVYHLVKEDQQSDLHFDVRQINCRTWKKPEDVETILVNWLGHQEENLNLGQ